MALRHRFLKAKKTIDGFSSDERKKLGHICENIQRAEEALNRGAADFLDYCGNTCGGLCCKNVDIDAIIGYHDFIYILALKPDLRRVIPECLDRREVIYPADCIFLRDGCGPCLFPKNTRPLLCIATFCGDDTPFKKEIIQVKRRFFQLERFILFRKPWELKRKLAAGRR